MMGTLEKTSDNSPKRDEKGRLLPGTPSLNPEGRPLGKSIKDRVRQFLEDHPHDMEAFVQHFIKDNRELAWQMLEGRPQQSTDITSKGDKLEGIAVEIIRKNETTTEGDAGTGEELGSN